jgi:hypothetical protein
MRLFIACTPRTGNTWVRKLLAGNLDLVEYPVHTMGEIPWDDLAPRCVVAIHVYPSEELVALLRDRGFSILTTIRHPLDVLISILAYTQYQRKTKRWVSGEGGDESSLFGATPLDPAFLDYASSKRADVLFGVSMAWLPYAAAAVRYESLVEDPKAYLAGLFETLEVTPAHPVSEVIAQNTLERLRAIHTDNSHHFWRGELGLWRRLLPSEIALPIAEHHRPVFERLGYVCDSDPQLTRERARENWAALQVGPLEPPPERSRPKFSLFKR